LSDALNGLNFHRDSNLLVGIETSDDAAVYKLSADLAMVNTVDFITPPVDDPYWFGQIAAANSISDVYSMGGKPLTALNVVMFPSGQLDMGILREILRGGNDKVVEAGACLAGGHTVDDNEPKYGLCVNGVVHPDRIITNAGAKPGDTLILTKPLGSGVLFNAVRARKFDMKELERSVLPTVASLNRLAIERLWPLICMPVRISPVSASWGMYLKWPQAAVSTQSLTIKPCPSIPAPMICIKSARPPAATRPTGLWWHGIL
jgi:selenide,water dikinase